MNVFGSGSKAQIKTMHGDLQKIFNLAIKRSNVDFGVHQGGRTVEQQQEYFDNKKSKLNPRRFSTVEELAKVAKHIVISGHPEFGKSRAGDIHISEKYKTKSLTWDEVHLAYVAGVIDSCAKELHEKCQISHIIRWGADWDRDGIIALDHKLKDFPHHELISI